MSDAQLGYARCLIIARNGFFGSTVRQSVSLPPVHCVHCTRGTFHSAHYSYCFRFTRNFIKTERGSSPSLSINGHISCWWNGISFTVVAFYYSFFPVISTMQTRYNAFWLLFTFTNKTPSRTFVHTQTHTHFRKSPIPRYWLRVSFWNLFTLLWKRFPSDQTLDEDIKTNEYYFSLSPYPIIANATDIPEKTDWNTICSSCGVFLIESVHVNSCSRVWIGDSYALPYSCYDGCMRHCDSDLLYLNLAVHVSCIDRLSDNFSH